VKTKNIFECLNSLRLRWTGESVSVCFIKFSPSFISSRFDTDSNQHIHGKKASQHCNFSALHVTKRESYNMWTFWKLSRAFFCKTFLRFQLKISYRKALPHFLLSFLSFSKMTKLYAPRYCESTITEEINNEHFRTWWKLSLQRFYLLCFFPLLCLELSIETGDSKLREKLFIWCVNFYLKSQ
jgi:hypothetical protein